MTRKFIVALIFAAVVFAIALVVMFATPAAAGVGVTGAELSAANQRLPFHRWMIH